MVYAKKNVTLIKKCVRHFLIRNVPHFYGLPLDLCGKCIVRRFCQTHCNSAKNAGKASKSGALRGISTVHGYAMIISAAVIISAAAARLLDSF